MNNVKLSSVACSCLGKAVQMLVTDVHLVCLDVESPSRVSEVHTCNETRFKTPIIT